MPERLYQKRFDEFFHEISPQEITPAGFTGLVWPHRPEVISQPGRFVQEARAEIQIGSPEQAAAYLQQHVYTPFDQFDQEELWVLLLNNKNWITHQVMVYRGTVNSVLIRTVELFKAAIRVNAPALILSHCHPSTDPTPSPEDIEVTRQAVEVAALLGIELFDHLIIGGEKWISLRRKKWGFEEKP